MEFNFNLRNSNAAIADMIFTHHLAICVLASIEAFCYVIDGRTTVRRTVRRTVCDFQMSAVVSVVVSVELSVTLSVGHLDGHLNGQSDRLSGSFDMSSKSDSPPV